MIGRCAIVLDPVERAIPLPTVNAPVPCNRCGTRSSTVTVEQWTRGCFKASRWCEECFRVAEPVQSITFDDDGMRLLPMSTVPCEGCQYYPSIGTYAIGSITCRYCEICLSRAEDGVGTVYRDDAPIERRGLWDRALNGENPLTGGATYDKHKLAHADHGYARAMTIGALLGMDL